MDKPYNRRYNLQKMNEIIVSDPGDEQSGTYITRLND